MEESDVTSPQVTWDVKEGDVKIEELSEEEDDPSLALVNSDIKVEDPDSSSDNESEDGTADGSRPLHKCKYSIKIACCKHNQTELKDQEEGKGVPFKCLDCEEPFTTDCGLYYHVMRKHFKRENKTKGFRCSICAKSRKSWSLLARHMIGKHGIRYSQMLRPTLSLREGLMTILLKKKNGHEQVGVEVGVSENEKFPCSSCHKSFYFKYDLMVHVQERHQLGKYQCSTCKRRFPKNSSLKRHLLRAHNIDGRNTECSLCTTKCASDIGLYTHLLTKHHNVKYSEQKDMDMTCSICGFLEKGGVRLARHMMKQHGVKGSQLSLPSRTSDGINLTIKVMNYQQGVHGVDASWKCLVCDCSFKCDRAWYSHICKAHTPYPHQLTCSICGAKQNGCMNLANHMVFDHSLRYSMLSMPTSSSRNSNEVTILVNKDASGTSMNERLSDQTMFLHSSAINETAPVMGQQATSASTLAYSSTYQGNREHNSQYQYRNQLPRLVASEQPGSEQQPTWKQQPTLMPELRFSSHPERNGNQNSLYQMPLDRYLRSDAMSNKSISGYYCSCGDSCFTNENGLHT